MKKESFSRLNCLFLVLSLLRTGTKAVDPTRLMLFMYPASGSKKNRKNTKPESTQLVLLNIQHFHHLKTEQSTSTFAQKLIFIVEITELYSCIQLLYALSE